MTEFSSPLEKSPSKRERVKELFDYLAKTSGDRGWLAKVRAGATQGFLGLVDKLSGSMEGWKAVAISEKKEGIAGYVGSYGFEGKTKDNDLTPDKVIRLALETVKDLKEVEFATINNGEVEFKKREKDDPWVRLVVPGEEEELRFMEVSLNQVEGWLKAKASDGKRSKLVEILMDGFKDDKKDLIEWKEMKNEPPWLVLSMTGSEELLRVHDPRMLMHLGIGGLGLKVEKLRLDFGHVAINGAPTLSKFEKMFEDTKPKEEGEENKEKWVSVKGFLDQVTLELVDGEVGVEEWGGESFGEAVNERELAEAVGVGVEMRVRLKVPKEMMKYFLKWSKDWGGSVGLWSLAALLTAGQAAFIPIEQRDGKGLQIGLGLGGGELTERLREAVAVLNGSKEGLNRNQRLKKIADFWSFFEQGGWKEAFEEEIERGRQGFGTPTALAEMTGGKLRESIEKASDRFVPKLSVLLKSRWQVSSLGRVPDNLARMMEEVIFDTAGSKGVSVGVGMLGEMISGRFFMKDPLFWAEALVHLMRGEGSVRIDELKKAMELTDWREKGVNKKGVEMVNKWIDSYQAEEGVDGSSFLVERGEELNIMNYLRSVGKDSRRREDVIEFSRALVVVVNQMIKSEKDREVNSLRDSLKLIAQGLAKEKLEWLVVHAGELAMLSELREILMKKDNQQLGDMKEKYNWIEEVRKEIGARRQKVMAGVFD